MLLLECCFDVGAFGMGATAMQLLFTATQLLPTAIQLLTTAIQLLNCTGSTTMQVLNCAAF